jgi:riboflavin synthase
MFTGIIETAASVAALNTDRTTGILRATFSTPLTSELKVDQSIAHNGVCLTVVAIDGNQYSVDIIPETLAVTNFGELSKGDRVNLERAMISGGRLDGHMVQGHVDAKGTVSSIQDGYWHFSYPPKFDPLVVMKGSICINGVSLTVTHSAKGTFGVALIPYTLEHTNLGDLKAGDSVNLEFDILGKYVQKNLAHFQQN